MIIKMMIENASMNRDPKEDIAFMRALLDKHSQLMRMYLRHNNIKLAKEQFEILAPIYNILNDKGESMTYYTPEDFKSDSERFKRKE